MKKIFFLLAMFLAFSVTSCKPTPAEVTETATDTTEVAAPSVDTTNVDTTTVDTVKQYLRVEAQSFDLSTLPRTLKSAPTRGEWLSGEIGRCCGGYSHNWMMNNKNMELRNICNKNSDKYRFEPCLNHDSWNLSYEREER